MMLTQNGKETGKLVSLPFSSAPGGCISLFERKRKIG